MRAAIYQGKKKVDLGKLPTPHAGDNDVVIKNNRASICGSDIAVYQHGLDTGHKIKPGIEFGHEMVSEVFEAGKKVKGFAVGDRVYPYPLLARGDTSRAGSLGGFSEYILVPNAELNKQLYKVPETISDKTAALIEPFTVGTRAARRGQPQEGENAVVFGAGTIGIAAAIALKHFGCNKVLVVDLSDYRLNIVKKLGFETCNSRTEDLQTKMLAYFGEAYGVNSTSADADIYIDAVGAPDIINGFLQNGKLQSKFVVVGVHSAKQEIDLLALTYASKSILGSGGYFPEDVNDVLKIMGSGKYDIESIVTHEYKWEELIQAIETASDPSQSLNVEIVYK